MEFIRVRDSVHADSIYKEGASLDSFVGFIDGKICTMRARKELHNGPHIMETKEEIPYSLNLFSVRMDSFSHFWSR